MDYHQDRFEDFSLLIYKNEELVAILPANRKEQEAHSHQGLTYGGLIVHEQLKLRDFIQCFYEVISFYNGQGVSNLYIKELPSIYSMIPNDEFLYVMFLVNAELYRRDALSVVNLNSKVKISKDRNAGVKRAEKHNLRVEEVSDFKAFWNELLIPNLNEKHNQNPVHSLSEIQFLKSKFDKNIRQFNVYDGDKIVAGSTIFETKHVAHSQYISGNNDKNILGSLDFLHAYLINEVFKDKTYFDFGISNENQGKQINAGLNYWKEGFGARTITQSFYGINTANFVKLNNVMV